MSQCKNRKRGGSGPLKPRVMDEVMRPPDRKTKYTCADCPLWKPCYCPIIVRTMVAIHPACRYGLWKISIEQTKLRNAAKRRPGNGERGKC